MKVDYYLSKSGHLFQKDYTLVFEYSENDKPDIIKKIIPIETVDSLHVTNGVKLNTDLLIFLNHQKIQLNIYSYKNDFVLSVAHEETPSGEIHILQALHAHNDIKRLIVAKEILHKAFNIMGFERDLSTINSINELMGVEGSIRKEYYKKFSDKLKYFKFTKRTKNPPESIANSLISYGNMICYAACVAAIRQTQLDTSISFIHAPQEARHSLALDIAEIFKPMFVDKIVINMINNRMVKENDFEKVGIAVLMKQLAKKKFNQEWDNLMRETEYNETLKRNVSNKAKIRLECYRLLKHISGIEPFK